jgi:hypothetical protein
MALQRDASERVNNQRLYYLQTEAMLTVSEVLVHSNFRSVAIFQNLYLWRQMYVYIYLLLTAIGLIAGGSVYKDHTFNKIYFCTKLLVPSSNSSSFIAIKSNDTEKFRMTAVSLLYTNIREPISLYHLATRNYVTLMSPSISQVCAFSHITTDFRVGLQICKIQN